MRRLLSYLLIGLSLLVFAPPGLAFSQFARSGDTVVIEADEVINQAFYTVAGDTVEIYGTVTGDLYAAGGSVYLEGTINGDLIVAGGQLTLNGVVEGNLRAAGGNINIGGEVAKNVLVAGGNVNLEKGGIIGGGGLIAGGNVSVLSDVNQQVLIAGGNNILGGFIGGNTEVYGGQLTVSPSASVVGELAYNDEIQVNISPNATVSGGTREIVVPKTDFDQEKIKTEAQAFKQVFSLGFSLISFISALILGLIMIRLMPNYVVTAIRQFGEKKGLTLAVGFGVLIGTPIVSILMLITIFLAPLALFSILIYMILLYLAKIYLSYWVGRVVANRFNQNWNKYVIYVVGLCIFFVLKGLPVVGIFVSIFGIAAGLGMAVLGEKTVFQAGRKANIL